MRPQLNWTRWSLAQRDPGREHRVGAIQALVAALLPFALCWAFLWLGEF